MYHTIWVVSLFNLVELELSGLCFVIGIFHTCLDVPVKDTFASDDWIGCIGVMSDGLLISSVALQLLLLHGANGSSVSVSLTIHVAEGARVERAAHQRFLSLEAFRADSRCATSA